MPDIDERLEQQLEALEKGIPLETILDGLQDDRTDLEPLIRLAAAVRSLPHPEPLPEQAKAREQRIMSVAQKTAGLRAEERRNPSRKPFEFNWKPLRWAFAPAMLGVMVAFLCVAASMFGLGMWYFGPHSAQAATLMDITGQVEVASPSASDGWRVISNGDQVRAGQRIRTLSASSATLVFFDGTRTTIDPNSDLTLTRVDGDWGKVLRVVLTQNAGEINNSVVPLRGKTSSFIVYTPSGVASVHGTNFNVAIGPQGSSRFAVNAGKVLVTNDDSEVYLTAGQATLSLPGQTLEDPAYQFNITGSLISKQAGTWTVSGVTFLVDGDTSINGDPQEKDVVHVEGRVLENGTWVADSVETVDGNGLEGSFTGILQSKDGQDWVVDGKTVQVNSQTDLGVGLVEGSPVRVSFMPLEDGTWVAFKIELLQSHEEGPAPEPSATPDPLAKPNLSFEPDELEVPGCRQDGSSTFDFSGTLLNTSDFEKDVAANVELGYQIIKGAQFVNSVELDPATWPLIAAGEQVNFNIHVALDTNSWQSADEDAEVKLRVFISSETNRLSYPLARLTVTIESRCEGTPKPEETEVPTATWTPTITPTITTTVTPSDTITTTETLTQTLMTTAEALPAVTDCTGANPQPTGERLARQYGVPYEEIMGWFCQGFGFGEIDLAYSLSQQPGVAATPAEIFAMKSSGMGWGQIKQELTPKPAKPPKDNVKDKKDKKTK
jgi:hypothetical protein